MTDPHFPFPDKNNNLALLRIQMGLTNIYKTTKSVIFIFAYLFRNKWRYLIQNWNDSESLSRLDSKSKKKYYDCYWCDYYIEST